MKKLFFLLSVALLINVSFAGISAAGADYPQPGDGAGMDGGRLVYMGWYQGNWDVFMKDAGSGTVTRITDNPGVQGFPDIQGKYIVWQDSRENPATGSFDIYLYNTEDQTEKKISQTPGDHREPLIRDGRVIWTDHDWGKKDVYLYDITSGTQNKISSDGSQAFGLVFDGEAAAWVDFRDGGNDLYAYNVSTQTETRVTSGKDVNLYLVADNGRVAWAENDQGSYQVKLLDTAANSTGTIATGSGSAMPVALSGGYIIISENGGFSALNINTGVETPLQISAADPRSVQLQGNEVVWLEGGKMNSQVIPAADFAAGAVPDKTAINAEPVLIKSDRQCTVSSPDGLAVFTFEPGTFGRDVNIIPWQDAYEIPGFTRVSPVYWLDGGDSTLQKPFSIAITCRLAGDDPKKAAIFQNRNGKWVCLPLTREGEGILSVVDSMSPVAVLIKQAAFTDTLNHWGKRYLEVMASHGIINGYTDNTFRPDRQITRAEFTAILAGCSGPAMENKGGESFLDVPESHWACSAIHTARQHGWVGGYPGNLFHPDQPITREEMAAMIIRYGGIETVRDRNYLGSFEDSGSISGWARDALNTAVAGGVIKGDGKILRPQDNTTRAEASVMLYQFLDQRNSL